MWLREFANEVNADSVPAIFRDWQWMQLTHQLATFCLISQWWCGNRIAPSCTGAGSGKQVSLSSNMRKGGRPCIWSTFPATISHLTLLMSGPLHRSDRWVSMMRGLIWVSWILMSFWFFPTFLVLTEPMNMVPARILPALVEEFRKSGMLHTSNGVICYWQIQEWWGNAKDIVAYVNDIMYLSWFVRGLIKTPLFIHIYTGGCQIYSQSAISKTPSLIYYLLYMNTTSLYLLVWGIKHPYSQPYTFWISLILVPCWVCPAPVE